jgi:hypothetical protein
MMLFSVSILEQMPECCITIAVVWGLLATGTFSKTWPKLSKSYNCLERIQ